MEAVVDAMTTVAVSAPVAADAVEIPVVQPDTDRAVLRCMPCGCVVQTVRVPCSCGQLELRHPVQPNWMPCWCAVLWCLQSH